MQPPMKCMTYNVRGLCNTDKCKLIWNYIHTCCPHIVFLQEHNLHKFASKLGYFSGFYIMYAGVVNFSRVVAIARQDLHPTLAYNDPQGCWMVAECLQAKEVQEFGCMPTMPLCTELLCGLIRLHVLGFQKLF